MKTELKPCPFCGSAVCEENIWEHSGGGYYQVQCENCGSMTDFVFGRDKAIEAWNRRAENG